MLELPKLILFNGDWEKYEEQLYEIFKKDFLDSRPYLKKVLPVTIIKEPKFKGKEWSFWHLTSKGKIESERKPDFRKCERIAWIKPIIESFPDCEIKAWPVSRGREVRICLCYGDWEYLVVLKKVLSGFMLITTHPIEYQNTKLKLKKQYESYLKSKKTKTALEGGIATPSTHGR